MGYRHYFALVEKTKVEEIKNLTAEEIRKEFANLTVDEQDEFSRRIYGDIKVSDEHDYIYERVSPLKYGGITIHELGKLYFQDTETRLLKSCKKIDFKDQEIAKIFNEDTLTVIASKETLKEYAIICMEKMIAYYESLLTTTEKIDYIFFKMEKDLGEGKTQKEKDIILYQKLKSAIEEDISWRKYNLELSKRKDSKVIQVPENYGEIAMKMKTIIEFGVIDFEKYELILRAY